MTGRTAKQENSVKPGKPHRNKERAEDEADEASEHAEQPVEPLLPAQDEQVSSDGVPEEEALAWAAISGLAFSGLAAVGGNGGGGGVTQPETVPAIPMPPRQIPSVGVRQPETISLLPPASTTAPVSEPGLQPPPRPETPGPELPQPELPPPPEPEPEPEPVPQPDPGIGSKPDLEVRPKTPPDLTPPQPPIVSSTPTRIDPETGDRQPATVLLSASEPGILHWETTDGFRHDRSTSGLWELPADLIATPGSLRYWQEDFAGNASEKVVLHVDITAPPPLSLQAVHPANGDGRGGTVRMHVGDLNVSGLEPDATWRYSIDGGAWREGGSAVLGAAELRRAGNHEVRVMHIDAHGNESDVQRVPVEVASPLRLSLLKDTGNTPEQRTDLITSKAAVQVEGITELHGKVEYQIDGGTWQLLNDGKLIDTASLPDGKRRVEVRVLDANDLTTAVERLDFVVDRSNPDQSPLVVSYDRGVVLRPTTAGRTVAYDLTNKAEVRIVGAEAGSAFLVARADEISGKRVEDPIPVHGELLPKSVFKEGPQLLVVTLDDQAGNIGKAIRFAHVWLDTIAPPAPALTVLLSGQGRETVDVTNRETQAHLQYRAVGTDEDEWKIAHWGENLRGPVEIRQVDRAGNASAVASLSSDQELYIDHKTAPPEVPRFERMEAEDGRPLLIPANVEKGAVFQYRPDGQAGWKDVTAGKLLDGPGEVRQVDAQRDISLTTYVVKAGETISLLPPSNAVL